MATPDLNDLGLLQEVVEVEGGASSEDFFNPPLADDGEHRVVFKLGNRGIQVKRQFDKNSKKNDGPGFLNVHLQLVSVLDTGGEGPTIGFDNLTSIVMPNAGTSRLHAAMDLAGFPLPARATLGDLKEAVEQALAQGPQAMITTQWEAQVNRGTKEKPDYETVVKGQKNFPAKLDGNGNVIEGRFDPEVTDPKSGATVRANARIVRYAPAG
jgi:hypothetical protein